MKLLKDLKSYVVTNGFGFLQETDSHGKTNSCRVSIGYYGTKNNCSAINYLWKTPSLKITL